MVLSPGTRLGPYEVTALIGTGGMIALINPGNLPQEGPCAGLRWRAARLSVPATWFRTWP